MNLTKINRTILNLLVKAEYSVSKKIKKYNINQLVLEKLLKIVYKEDAYRCNIDNSNSPLGIGANEYTYPEIICGWINNVYLYGINFIFILHKNEYYHINDFYNSLNGNSGMAKYAHHGMIKKNNIFFDHAVILYEIGSDFNYFHWITDSLSKIYVLDRIEDLKLLDITIIIPNGMNTIHESLLSFGFSDKQIYVVNGNESIRINNLLYISKMGNPGDPRPEICKFINSKLCAREDNHRINKIYISRSTSSRRLKNEQQLQYELIKKGYKIYKLEEINFMLQVRIFSEAKVIVAEHGAGLTNIVFCKPDVDIYEIFNKNYLNFCYWYIANTLKFKYNYIICVGNKILMNDIKKFP